MRRLGRALFWLVDGLVVAVFVAGYLAAYVHPATLWWLQPFAVVLPYASIGIAVLTVPAFILRRRNARWLHIALIGLIVIRFGPGWVAQGAAMESEDASLSILVFNTRNGANDAAAGSDLQALVAAEQPDVLALQETWVRRADPQTYAPFVQPLADAGYRLPDAPQAPAQTMTLPLLSNGMVEAYTQESHAYEGGQDQMFTLGRGVAHFGGRSAVIYNVHLRSHGEEKPWQADDPDWLSLAFWRPYLARFKRDYRLRAQQAERIRALLQAEEAPVVLVGDFNSSPHDWAYRHLAHGLTDAFVEAGAGWGATYHRRFPLVRIDHVLVSPALQAVHAEVLAPTFSDHLPQVVTLKWAVAPESEDSAKTDER